MDRAMLDGALLAYEMNGSPLPTDHGSPLRAIVPGLYGMMNCKWITSIEVVSGVYQGYWQVRGWKNDAEYQTGSEIVIPGDAQITDRFGIRGVERRQPRPRPHRRDRVRRRSGHLEGRGQHRRREHLDHGVSHRPALELYVGVLVCAVEPRRGGGLPGHGPRYRRDWSGTDGHRHKSVPQRGDGLPRGRHICTPRINRLHRILGPWEAAARAALASDCDRSADFFRRKGHCDPEPFRRYTRSGSLPTLFLFGGPSR